MPRANGAGSMADPGAGVADPDPVADPVARRRRMLAVAAMLGCTTAYGGGLVMSKAALSAEAGLPPLPLLLVQLTASVAVLAVLTLAASLRRAHRRRSAAASTDLRRTSGRRVVWAGWPGVVEPGLAYIALIVGLGLTTAGNASVVGSTEPVLTAAGAWLVFRERLGVRMVLLWAWPSRGCCWSPATPSAPAGRPAWSATPWSWSAWSSRWSTP